MRGYPVRLHIPTGESKNETGSTPIKAGLEIHPDFDMDEIRHKKTLRFSEAFF